MTLEATFSFANMLVRSMFKDMENIVENAFYDTLERNKGRNEVSWRIQSKSERERSSENLTQFSCASDFAAHQRQNSLHKLKYAN